MEECNEAALDGTTTTSSIHMETYIVMTMANSCCVLLDTSTTISADTGAAKFIWWADGHDVVRCVFGSQNYKLTSPPKNCG